MGERTIDLKDGNRKDVLARALVEVRELREKLERAERAQREPIAVIGIGCRFPGRVHSPEDFWQLLTEGIDATGDAPAGRWAAADSKIQETFPTRGGYLDEVDRFDAQFFGLGRTEVRSMDPQHRLLLEVSWQALEHAAVPPDRLYGSRCGVFVGLSASDYAHLLARTTPLDRVDGYFGLGTAFSFAPGRLSHLLGLQGPSLAVDTACSSSLVAVHLACQSLRSGDSDLALAGGVSLMLTPQTHAVLGKAGALSRDGRCKTFDANADGYARGEGCGVVVLRRLGDALARKDRILALIRGTAVNQDGPSSGLTVPNGAAQQALIQDALTAAGVASADISYLEAHGTGTPLGDPIEVRALAAALGAGRPPERPLWVGSVKTNIGHLEAGAGVAGLIKTVLAVHHAEIPPHLHVDEPNPAIAWRGLPVQVVTERMAWPEHTPRLAGVSSFGASGTNAHAVLEAPPPPPPLHGTDRPDRSQQLLVLSARCEPALRELAERYSQYLKTHSSVSLTDICATAIGGRTHHRHRLAVVGESHSELADALAEFTTDGESENVIRGHHQRPDPPKVAFLFAGQGERLQGLGRELLETQPVFRRELERCAAILRPQLARSLLEVMSASSASDVAPENPVVSQVALFAFEWALVKLWRSWGVVPQAVLGHSLGELVAACVAGVVQLEEALEWVVDRAELMAALPTPGAMAALFAGEAQVARAVRTQAGRVSIAAVNAPTETVISGTREAVAAVVDRLTAEGVRSRGLQVSHGFHSPLLEPMLDAFEHQVAQRNLELPHLTLVSSLTGRAERGELTQASYWRQQLRQPVRFGEAIATLQTLGFRSFVEIGPSAVLSTLGRRCVATGAGTWLPSCRGDDPTDSQLLESLAALYVRGVRVDGSGLYDRASHRVVSLPTYPFQSQRFWLRSPAVETVQKWPGRRLGRSPSQTGEVFETELAANELPILRDHRVFGHIVVSGAVHLAFALAAAEEMAGPGVDFLVANVRFLAPLILPEEGTLTLRTMIDGQSTANGAGDSAFRIESLDEDGLPMAHTEGRIKRSSAPEPPARQSIDDLKARCPAELGGEEFYRHFWRPDEHELGPAFRALDHIWFCDRPREGLEAGEALARLRLPSSELAPESAGLDPSWMLGVCLGEVVGQALMPAVPGFERLLQTDDATFLGQSLQRSLDYAHAPERAAYCYSRCHRFDGAEMSGDVVILDEDGQALAGVEGLTARRVERSQLRCAVASISTRRRSSKLGPLMAMNPEQIRDQVGLVLRSAISDLLGISGSDLRSDDDLGSLGTDSIQMLGIQETIRSSLEVEIDLERLASGMTLAQLTESLSQAIQARQVQRDRS